MLLQADHGNMTKVLDLIQQQVKNMAQGAPVNHRLLESAFAYVSEYLDQCHHPKEELVYRKLLSRCPDMAESLKGLVAEYTELARLTENLSQAIREARWDRPASNERLATPLTEFPEYYRHHILMEEQQFLPAARRLLSRENFEEIDFALFDQADLLFNREVEERFIELRNEILRLGGTECEESCAARSRKFETRGSQHYPAYIARQ